MIKRIAAVALATGLALSAVAATAPTADANPEPAGESKTVRIRTDRGAVYFYNYGDQLHVGDYLKDGYGIRGYGIVNGTRHTVYTNSGVNTVDDKNLHLKEGTAVWIQLCYTKKGKDVKCSGMVKGYA